MTAKTRTLTRFAAAAALAASAALVAGCNPILTSQSVAPPGRAARLDEVRGFWGIQRYRMELTQGVALAVTCTWGGPCERLEVTSDDPAIAEVRRASLGTLERAGFANRATSSAMVVVGKSPGTTTVRVRAKEGHREIAVTVVAPPAASPAKTAQR
jgi:hypothetical protein